MKRLLMISALAYGAAAWAEHGGISGGGGGGTSNPSPARIEWVRTATRESKVMLTAWLQAEQIRYFEFTKNDPTTNPLWKLFFDSSPDVFTVLKDLPIEFRETAPCFDPQGVAVDGSVNPNQSPALCISGFTLAGKLTEYNYEYETSALVMHEIAHVMGASEEEAVTLQKHVLHSLLHASTFDYVGEIQAIDRNQLSELQGLVNYLPSYHENKMDDLVCRSAEQLARGISELRHDLYSYGYSISALNKDESDLLYSVLIKSYALRDYGCSKESEPRRIEYEKGFGSETVVTARTYHERTSAVEDLPRKLDLPIRKITSDSVFDGEVQEIENEIRKIGGLLDELARLTRFRLVVR